MRENNKENGWGQKEWASKEGILHKMGKQWSESSHDKVKECYDSLSTLKFTACAKELKIQWHLQRKTRFRLGLKEKCFLWQHWEWRGVSEGGKKRNGKERSLLMSPSTYASLLMAGKMGWRRVKNNEEMIVWKSSGDGGRREMKNEKQLGSELPN